MLTLSLLDLLQIIYTGPGISTYEIHKTSVHIQIYTKSYKNTRPHPHYQTQIHVYNSSILLAT